MLFSGSLISGAFSGLLSAGILGGMDGALGMAAWRWLFIVEGAGTIAIALAFYFVMPDLPRSSSDFWFSRIGIGGGSGWLTEEERAMAIWRLEEDIGEDDVDMCADAERSNKEKEGGEKKTGSSSFWAGARMALSDGKTYVFVSDRLFPFPFSSPDL